MDRKSRRSIAVAAVLACAAGAAAWRILRSEPESTPRIEDARRDPAASEAPPPAAVLAGPRGGAHDGPRPLKPRSIGTEAPPEPRKQILGTVVDLRGNRVTGVRLRLTTTTPSIHRPYATLAEMLGEGGMPGSEPARDTTNEDGAFAVAGEAGYLISESPEWLVHRRVLPFFQGAPAPDVSGVQIVVEPAVSLGCPVTDASTGKPIVAFEGHIRANESGFGFSGKDGMLDLVWPLSWDSSRGFRVEVSVEAPGYQPWTGSFPYGPGEHRVEGSISMIALREGEEARVAFEVVDRDGVHVEADWTARIVERIDPDKTIQQLDAVRDGPGLFHTTAPAGRFTVLVKTYDGLGYLRWVQDLDFVGGRDQTFRCVVPPHGSLVVRGPDASFSGGRPVYVLRAGERVTSVVTMIGNDFRAPALEQGDYTVTLDGFDKPRAVRVVSGEEAVVDFTRR